MTCVGSLPEKPRSSRVVAGAGGESSNEVDEIVCGKNRAWKKRRRKRKEKREERRVGVTGRECKPQDTCAAHVQAYICSRKT